MGKIVKYCAACEEGFAEKFGFCPNCGAQLTAFELNPVETLKAEESKVEPVETTQPPSTPIIETPAETAPAAETLVFSADSATDRPAETTDGFEFSDDVFEEPVPATQSFEAPEIPATESFNDNLHQATFAQTENETPKTSVPHYVPDYGFRPTIVVEKNVRQRNLLLLGAFLLGCTLMVGSFVYSIFNKYLDIAAIETPDLLAYVDDLAPAPMDLEEPKKKEDKGGGGGGGGKDEPTPVSKGREAAQVNDPLIAPSYNMPKLTDPDLKIQAATKNKNERPAENTDEPYGLRNGGNILSDGTGTGGGQGGGRGRGQGNGDGGGIGNGNGDGRGNGDGDGEGDGSGGGGGGGLVVKKPTPAPIGPTEGVKILSKPRANYTDAARQNQVQGKVVLRVTFSANGSIGGISVISGLGNGLTEQAIAAARGIKFEPAKRGGVPYSVTKPVEYSFTIY
jgi:TonB family protein